MTVVLPAEHRTPVGPLGLALALAAAVAVRVALAGPVGAASRPAALAFAVLLGACVAVVRPATRWGRRVLVTGMAGGAALVLPVLVVHGVGDVHPGGSYAGWAVVTAVVATAEEAFLRGALHDAVARRGGADLAVAVTAVAFAALHLPLYGWGAAPLDLAVGVALAAMRLVAGSWIAPAMAHAGADLLGWWLV